MNNDKHLHDQPRGIAVLPNLRFRGTGARRSSIPRRTWGWGRSRKAAGPAAGGGWTLYPPRGTGRWWEPRAFSWKTSPAGAQPAKLHNTFPNRLIQSFTCENLLRKICYAELRTYVSCMNPAQLQPSCTLTYRKNGRPNGVHKQSLNVVWSHFLPKHWCAVIIQGVFVVGVQPPEDTGPTCKQKQIPFINEVLAGTTNYKLNSYL